MESVSGCFLKTGIAGMNRFLKTGIATLVDEQQSDWDTVIDCVCFAYRTTINTKTSEIPFYLLYGRDVVLPTDLIFKVKYDSLDSSSLKLDYKYDLTCRLMTAYRALIEKKSAYSEKYKTYYDRGKKDIKFNSGDLVMVYWPEQKKGMSKKFLHKGEDHSK